MVAFLYTPSSLKVRLFIEPPEITLPLAFNAVALSETFWVVSRFAYEKYT